MHYNRYLDRKFFWSLPIAVTISMIYGLVSGNFGALAFAGTGIVLLVAWWFFHLVRTAKAPGLWYKIAFGWTLLFVCLGGLWDSALFEDFEPYEPTTVKITVGLVFAYALPMVFLLHTALQGFFRRLTEMTSRPENPISEERNSE
ncbi:MAG: hypothetical protein AAF764_06710 [Pseudomonadota bacterium]